MTIAGAVLAAVSAIAAMAAAAGADAVTALAFPVACCAEAAAWGSVGKAADAAPGGLATPFAVEGAPVEGCAAVDGTIGCAGRG